MSDQTVDQAEKSIVRLSPSKRSLLHSCLTKIVKRIRQDSASRAETLAYKHETVEAVRYDEVMAVQIIQLLESLP